MLEIFNKLEPFFEDCYRRINVREYARLIKISPPTASGILKEYKKIGLLIEEKEKQYFYYSANKDSGLFIDLSRMYWKNKFMKSGLMDFLEKELLSPIIILFGSLSKAETKKDSDIDVAIFTKTKKQINFDKFEKLLKRNIQSFVFKGRNEIKNIGLLNNILNGYKIKGNW